MVRAKIQRRHSHAQEYGNNTTQQSSQNKSQSSTSSLCYTILILSVMLLLFAIITPIILLITIENHRYEKESNNMVFFDAFDTNNDTDKIKFLSMLRKPNDIQQPKGIQKMERKASSDVDINPNKKEVKYFDKLPSDKTPCLEGSKKGHINCDVDVDFLVYWNDPQGTLDRNFISPFAEKSSNNKDKTHYITFEPDRGAWNNIRMSMECMFILAVATGRTLVLPPPKPLYLMKDAKKRNHGFADFYPLDGNNGLFDHVPVISMEKFIKKEGSKENGGNLPVKKEVKENVFLASKECENFKKSK